MAAACGAAGCSEIVGIEDRSGSWCSLEAEGHDFCEDFDQDDPFAAWAREGSPRTAPSDRSAPNALLAPAGTLLQRDFDLAGEAIELSADVHLFAEKPDAAPTTAHDHGLAMVSRSGGTVGLFASGNGTLLFGSLSSIPAVVPGVSASARWVRFTLRVDRQVASLATEGGVVATWDQEEPSGDDKDSGGTRVVIGAQALIDGAAPIECWIDNVVIDGAGVGR
jgi:hypothetical protein